MLDHSLFRLSLLLALSPTPQAQPAQLICHSFAAADRDEACLPQTGVVQRRQIFKAQPVRLNGLRAKSNTEDRSNEGRIGSTK